MLSKAEKQSQQPQNRQQKEKEKDKHTQTISRNDKQEIRIQVGMGEPETEGKGNKRGNWFPLPRIRWLDNKFISRKVGPKARQLISFQLKLLGFLETAQIGDISSHSIA